eukprot:14702565-Heterocapsa_arctica.AAC.1
MPSLSAICAATSSMKSRVETPTAQSRSLLRLLDGLGRPPRRCGPSRSCPSGADTAAMRRGRGYQTSWPSG